MASKQNFTPDEWTKVLQSTMLARIAVSAADPSGLWGALKEAARGSSAVIAARSSGKSNELIKAVASDFETPRARSDVQKALKDCFAGAPPTDCVQRSLAHLREVSKILDAKAPADAAAFKRGFATSVRMWRRRLPREASSASAAFASATPRKPLSTTLPRPSAAPLPMPGARPVGPGTAAGSSINTCHRLTRTSVSKRLSRRGRPTT